MAEIKELKVEDIKAAAENGLKCPVQKALHYVSGFLAGPMCGKCFPCSMGSYEAKLRLTKIASGSGTPEDIDALRRITAEMLEASMCKKGKDTARFVLEWLDSPDFAAHLHGNCPAGTCQAFMQYVIVPDKCTMCGDCREACKHNAILGEKRKSYLTGYLPYEIRQKRCVKCGDCIKVCLEGAIIFTGVKSEEPAGV